ncbi:Reverse_transcriptase (RNA-dependent DNA polymerase) [Hexamita inflata]|uniref:Reverse transcriptase (RNA-dependent DNA polymerase) n=1 Tax=Hexamita inflata TaxID=28002 RepID=A0AA86PPD6_9EUKA|nr:Reverse transcriptase (RNA-dependent DNA polymerase) [Hexamita inflata]
MTAQHEIRCSRNAGIRTVRHDYMVNCILTKIDHHRHPRPVDKAHGNLPVSDKLEKPDIEFQYKNATYVLDVTFAAEANICNAFKGKILKYGGTYGDNRVIPLVLRYNGTVYEKSMNMLTTFLPEITDSFLSKYCRPRGCGSKARRRSPRQCWIGRNWARSNRRQLKTWNMSE